MRPSCFRRFSTICIMAGALGLVAVTAANSWCYGQAKQERMRRELPRGATNSLKHAFAAAELYALLRPMVEEDTATRVVLTLGVWNEYAEYTFRSKARLDSLAETAKDLYNNSAGVTLAEWLRDGYPQTGRRDRIERLGELATKGGLALAPDDARLLPGPDKPVSYNDLARVIAWSQEEHETVAFETRAKLER